MRNKAPDSDEEIGPLNEAQTARLLRLGLTDTSAAVGNLTYRLHSEDGKAWFCEVLEAQTGLSAAELLLGKASFSKLETVKSKAKVQFASSDTFEGKLRGMLCYFIAIALAKNHYDLLISSRPAHEISVALLDLAGELPEPWTELLGRGALALE